MGEEGLVFAGILFLCIGIGIMTGRIAAWTMIGLGAGFLAMAAVRLLRRARSRQEKRP